MKKYIFTLIFGVCIVSLFFTFSCLKEENGTKNSVSPSEIINIGEAHNAGLDMMLSKLKSLPKTRADKVIISRIEFEALALETTKEIVDGYGLDKEHKKKIHNYLDKMVADRIFDDVEITYSELTPTQESFARELDAILMDEDQDMTSLLGRISAVEARARITLTGQDLETVLSGCYVASYTLQYWHDNADAWIELSPKELTRDRFSWKSLGRADLQGGVAAGFGGLGTMLLKCGPTGWKGWAALVIGGAVGGSVVNAWDQLWPE